MVLTGFFFLCKITSQEHIKCVRYKFFYYLHPKVLTKASKVAADCIRSLTMDEGSPSLENGCLRRRGFAHYDCRSIGANLGYAARLRSLLSRRRNTTTGASAASTLAARSTTPDSVTEEDPGDGLTNDLLER